MNGCRPLPRFAAALLACAFTARAVTVEGDGWAVHYNIPDQDTGFTTGDDPDEWAIREALLRRVKALRAGDEAYLATYRLSGDSDKYGAAGPILGAVAAALDRGARVAFAADAGVDTAVNFGGGPSLAELAARERDPLRLARDDTPGGIMHTKLGLFDYGPRERWAFVTSWNFTGGASSLQWNIALELRSDELYAACAKEMEEMLAGRFHGNPRKSHLHDGTRFSLPGAWQEGRVRFAPYADGSPGGNNALADIVRAIDDARETVFFALNKLTRADLRDALIRAAERGVAVHGVMPRSDTKRGQDSYTVYRGLKSASDRGLKGSLRLHSPLSGAPRGAKDRGQPELVHSKYMVIDPLGARPVVIHGSANWTAMGLSSENGNDEIVLFVRHAGIARAFADHFRLLADLPEGEEE